MRREWHIVSLLIWLSLFKELKDWLKKNLKPHNMHSLNPDYDACQGKRPYPFRDLRQEHN